MHSRKIKQCETAFDFRDALTINPKGLEFF